MLIRIVLKWVTALRGSRAVRTRVSSAHESEEEEPVHCTVVICCAMGNFQLFQDTILMSVACAVADYKVNC